jgi:hypothetical protein
MELCCGVTPGNHWRLFKTGHAIDAVTLITRRRDHPTAKLCPRRKIFRPNAVAPGAAFPPTARRLLKPAAADSFQILAGLRPCSLLLARQQDRVTTQACRWGFLLPHFRPRLGLTGHPEHVIKRFLAARSALGRGCRRVSSPGAGLSIVVSCAALRVCDAATLSIPVQVLWWKRVHKSGPTLDTLKAGVERCFGRGA